jgi:hypothetical protein
MMSCHRRPASRMPVIALVVLLVLLVFGRAVSGRAAGHFFGVAAVVAVIAVAGAVAAVALVAAIAASGSARRRRAAAPGSASGRLRSRQPMTAGLPSPPRWPDRPVYRSGPVWPRSGAPPGNAPPGAGVQGGAGTGGAGDGVPALGLSRGPGS